MLRRMLRWIGGLLGLKAPRVRTPAMEAHREWSQLVSRYHAAHLQIRESGSPYELEVAHSAFLSARADLTWYIRLAKRDRGLPLRPVAETQRVYQAMLHHFRGPAVREGQPARRRWGRRG